MLSPAPRRLVLGCALLVALAACAGEGEGGGGAGGIGWTTSAGGAVGGGGGMGAAGAGGTSSTDSCPHTFVFAPAFSMSSPRIAGQWHDFDLASATPLSDPDDDGVFEATVALPPGTWAYKLVYQVDGETVWALDPAEGRRKYVDGLENSAVRVRDCNLPWLEVEQVQSSRPAPGQGSYQAELAFVDAFDQSGADPAAFAAELSQDGSATPLAPDAVTVAPDGHTSVHVSALADGKWHLRLTPATLSGRLGEPLDLVFWIEPEPFDWQGAVIYMVMVDRFANGDPSNDAPATPGVDPRADYLGGDLQGLRQRIEAGRLDQLGVRVIWLSPVQTNPTGGYLAADGVHQVAGYHGYWPTRAREVDPRIGGAPALEALVKTAHAHGIRVLADYVLNHVHQDHEYVAAHPEWFRTGCVCGTPGCDWTAHALDCMFRDYLPDVDHTNFEADQQWVDDAVWWLERFDLDGLRIDAVKHVVEAATRNLAAAVRERFEAGGTRYFLMGETAMGWSDCADPCNDDNYGTIGKYVGPLGLDGQLDFVLYHAVAYRSFAYGDKGMLHADYWFQHGQSKWPAGAIMTPYIGSHDTARFASMADYRGQDPAHDRAVVSNQWSNTAVAPGDAEPYRRARIALAWLLTLPGAPLLYYGDEYGQWGGTDPNNRMLWRDEGALGGDELATLSFSRKLGTARRDLLALRAGDYLPLGSTDDTLSFARVVPNGGPAALVSLTRLTSPQAVTVDAGAAGLGAGTVLHDALGGPDVTVAPGGSASYQVPASGAVILAP